MNTVSIDMTNAGISYEKGFYFPWNYYIYLTKDKLLLNSHKKGKRIGNVIHLLMHTYALLFVCKRTASNIRMSISSYRNLFRIRTLEHYSIESKFTVCRWKSALNIDPN